MNKKIDQAQKSPALPTHGDMNREYLSEKEPIELDAIERLKSNILMLDDLQARLRFMNNELESLVGIKKKRS